MKTLYILTIACCLWTISANARSGDDVRASGMRVIGLSEVIEGNVVVMTGDLVVRGTVHGSCIAHVGNIILEDTAVVHGDVVAKSGRVLGSGGARVTGNVVQGCKPKTGTVRGGARSGDE